MGRFGIHTNKARARNAARIAAVKQKDTTDLFTVYVKSELGAELVREYLFHPTRKWRFDYALPALRIAVECDGGVWTGGRHVSPQGYVKDMEKFNAAAELGWVVLKFTPQQLVTIGTIETLRNTISKRIDELAKQKKIGN